MASPRKVKEFMRRAGRSSAIRLSGGDTKQRGLDVVVGSEGREEEHVLFPLVVAFEMIMA